VPPLAPMMLLYDMFRAVTAAPDAVTVAFQALVTVWLPANVQVSAHPLMADAPRFVIVTLAVKPLPQSLRAYPMVQPVGLTDVDADGVADRLADGETDGEADGDRLGEAEVEAEGDADADRLGDGDADADRLGLGLALDDGRGVGGGPPLLAIW
jgi:hypothetical protein